MHANGRGGLPKDDVEAVRLYILAADLGYAPATVALGNIHREGAGKERFRKLSIKISPEKATPSAISLVENQKLKLGGQEEQQQQQRKREGKFEKSFEERIGRKGGGPDVGRKHRRTHPHKTENLDMLAAVATAASSLENSPSR